ncbi:MAG: efflux RND transporter periplasmic adaptor subunit [Deltaproteobacteria bacterium]|nr:efflux RND transporter periplasmic adaptor subunit [Deltaproteobacteria bacterium]
MKKGFILKAALFALWVGIYGCSATGEDKKPNEKVGQRPPVAVEVTKVTAANITDGIEVIGTLSSKFGAEVKSEYTGIVAEVYVTEWVQVEKGTPLARLDTREGELVLKKAQTAVEIAKANLMQVEVAANRANREYERALKLKEVGLITQQNLDDARTEREAAAVRISAAKAQIQAAEEDVEHAQTRLSKAIIRSPRKGVISWRNVNVGDYVGEMGAKPMFRIVDNRVLELTVTVPSGEMGAVRMGQALTFSTDAIPGKTFTGKVMFINPTVNESDRSVRVVAEVENTPEQLKGGLFVKGQILTGKRTGVIKIPRIALLTWDVAATKAEIFVVNENVAHRRTVRTGNISGDQVEIISGLASGQQVITRGGFNVKDGDKVNVTRVNGEK